MKIKLDIVVLLAFVQCCLFPFNSVAEDNKDLKKYMVLPIDAKVFEFTASGALQERPARSETATALVDEKIRNTVTKVFQVQPVPFETEDDELLELIEQHTALFNLLKNSRQQASMMAEWKPLLEQNPLSIGPGLSRLQEVYGVDYAILVSAAQAKSTGGRVGLAAVGFLAMGIAIPMGATVFSVSILDLQNGEVVWTGLPRYRSNLTSEDGVKTLVLDSLRMLPTFLEKQGIEPGEIEKPKSPHDSEDD